MFSKLAKSIKSIAKGPRAVLAENIAQALSEHFVLDPKDIESSLLKDARIVLKNTQLRSRRYRSDNVPNTVVSVNGVVEEVVFSWRWSFTGRSSESSAAGSSSGGMVQDVVLTIRGIKVNIVLNEWDSLDEREQALVENFESTLVNDDLDETETIDGTSLEEREGFIKKYVRQIVDHLTLKFEDFEFTIRAGSGPSVIIAGKDLELGTLSSSHGSDKTDGTRKLIQRISIGSFFVNVLDNESERPSPLIEPFGYAASVVRVSGERFKGGILSGLEIVGLPEIHNAPLSVEEEEEGRSDEGILFHIGLPQIQALSALGVMLAPSSSCGAESAPSEELKGHDGSRFSIDQNEEAEDTGDSTVFNLPLPALTIVLPSSGKDASPTKITLPRATVLYRGDGKVFQIEGQEGIKENGASLVKLAPGGKWSVDFVKKFVDLDKDGGGCKLSISNEFLRRISSSIASLSSADEITNLKDAWEGTESKPIGHMQEASFESWAISTGHLTLHLAGVDNEWLEVDVAHSSLSLSPEMGTLTRASVGNCTVKSSFDNNSIIAVPSFTLLRGLIHISDTIEVAVGSVENALQIRDFLYSFLQPIKQSDKFETIRPSSEIQELPFAIRLDRFKVDLRESDMHIDLKRLYGEGTSCSCEAALCIAGETKVESNNIHLNYLKSDVHIKIGTISSLIIPEVFVVSKPVLDVSILYRREGSMLIGMNKINATFERPKNDKVKSDTNNSKINIPFPIQLDLKYLTLRESGKSGLIGMKQIFVSINQSDSIFTVESRDGMKIRLQQSPNISIDATMGKISLQLQEDNGHFEAKEMKLFGAQLGPCSPSCGKLTIALPHIYQEDGQKLLFEKSVDVSFDSTEVFDKLRPLFDSIVGSQEGNSFDEFPFPVDIPGINISASEPQSRMQIGHISVIGSDVVVGKVQASVQDTISFSTKGLKANIKSNSLKVDFESLTLPGIMALSKPILMSMVLEKQVLHIIVPTPVHASMLPKITDIASKPSVSRTQQNIINIPFGIKMKVTEVNLKTLREGDTKCIQMNEISLDVVPTAMPWQDLLSGEMDKGAQISLEMCDIKHDLFKAQKIHTSLFVEFQDLDTLHQLQVSLHSPQVTAGYSSVDWSSLFNEKGPNDGAQQNVLKLPFARVASTSMLISVEGAVIGSQANIAIEEFKGDAFTTSEDLSKHYSTAVMKRMPGFLTNVNVLGTNVFDGSFQTAGQLALGARSIATSGIGSVVGTAAADGVKAAITAGKSSRNVSTDDSYKFGDISRGIVSGVRNATKRGARSRGSNGSDYVPGDFTIGAAESIGQYAGNNSEKLKSSAGSGIGATIGLAVAGPVGLLVGGYVGGKVGGDGNAQQKEQQKQQQQQRQLQSQAQYDNNVQQQQQRLNSITSYGNQGQYNSSQHQLQHYHSQTRQNQSHQYQQSQAQQHQTQPYQQQQQQQQHSHQYQQSQAQQFQTQPYQQQRQQQHFQPPAQQQGYKFGDITRGLVAKGKQADGRSHDSGYKFGDFTRGLFS